MIYIGCQGKSNGLIDTIFHAPSVLRFVSWQRHFWFYSRNFYGQHHKSARRVNCVLKTRTIELYGMVQLMKPYPTIKLIPYDVLRNCSHAQTGRIFVTFCQVQNTHKSPIIVITMVFFYFLFTTYYYLTLTYFYLSLF